MSYASVAANKIPSPSKNPLVINDNAKVIIASNGNDDDDDVPKPTGSDKQKSKYLREVEAEGTYLWEITRYYLTRPAVAGGLFGIVNIGLLAFAGRKFYRHPHLRRDSNAVSVSFAACIVLMIAEGYVATKYSQTQDQGRKVKKGGTVIFPKFSGHIGSLGGITGFVNTIVFGAVGYWSYLNWNKPWDRHTVSAISVGLLALVGGDGFLLKRYRKQNL